MRVKIGNTILQFSAKILNDNYKTINESEKSLIDFFKNALNNGIITKLNDRQIDVNILKEGKRKKMIENITKLANFIEKKYYVNKSRINFVEISYKTGLSISTIKRYLKNILKDKSIVTIQKDDLINRIKNNLGIQ